jgi:hypothetical protein
MKKVVEGRTLKVFKSSETIEFKESYKPKWWTKLLPRWVAKKLGIGQATQVIRMVGRDDEW